MSLPDQSISAPSNGDLRSVPVFDATPALHQMPVGELVVGIARESGEIVTKYVELAKLDLRQELSEVGRAAVHAAVALGMSLVGAILLGLALSAWLVSGFGWPVSVALATVGGGILAIAGVLAWLGIRRGREVSMPDAVPEAKEDIEWIGENT